MTKYQRSLFRSFYVFIVSLLVLGLISSHLPAQTPPTADVEIELYSINEPIETSPDIAEPPAQVEGLVRLTSSLPMHIEVNLSVENDWTATVEPANFTLNVVTGLAEQPITVTVIAPLGVENNTEHTVRVTGTWSYVQGIGGDEIQWEEFTLVARNETAEPDDNGDNNGDDGGASNNGDSFPMLELGIVVIIVIIIIVIIIIFRRRRRLAEDEEYYEDDEDYDDADEEPEEKDK
jgi:cbb3-type cytochrome oxidase subunit 3